MNVPGRIAALAVGFVAVGAVPAGATDYCVKVTRDGCVQRDSVTLALAAANTDATADRVYVGTHQETATGAPFADQADRPVTIIGVGEATKLGSDGVDATVRLSDPDSRISRVAITAPGGISGVAVQLLAGAELTDASVFGGVEAVAGGTVTAPARALRLHQAVEGRPALLASLADLVAESVDMTVSGAAPALRVTCSVAANATLTGRHLTLTGPVARAGLADCDGTQRAAIALANSLLPSTYGDDAFAKSGTGITAITTAWSAHPEDTDATATDRLTVEDPRFVADDDHRPRPDSPLVDAGDPAPLAAGEGLTDAGDLVRAVDGSGDGVVRRDVGAHERQPLPAPMPADNVLANPAAEAADPLAGWSSSGTFEAVPFGVHEWSPGSAAAEALAAGQRFFAGGTAADSELVQRIDVAGSAASIDTGRATAALTGLLGGYGADADEVRVEARFRDPAGVAIGALTLPGPAPAERGNATNLLARGAGGAILARTRAIDVAITAHRVGDATELYTDGYADNLALTLSVPGVTVPGPVDPGKPVVPGLKAFAGVTVLTGRPRLSSKGTVRIGLACESATVGRCSGTLELRAVPPGRKTAVRIARFGRFSIRPGRTKTVAVKLLLTRRRAFIRRRSFRATLLAVARDGQGLQRRKTVPVRVARVVAKPRR